MKTEKNTTVAVTYDQYSNMTSGNLLISISQETVKTCSTSELQRRVSEEPYLVMKDGMNVLGIIIFALVFGAIIGQAGQKALALKMVIAGLEHVTMQMVKLVIW